MAATWQLPERPPEPPTYTNVIGGTLPSSEEGYVRGPDQTPREAYVGRAPTPREEYLGRTPTPPNATRSTRRSAQRAADRERRRASLRRLKDRAVVQSARLRTRSNFGGATTGTLGDISGPRYSTEPLPPGSARRELRAVAVQSKQSVRSLARRAAENAGVSEAPMNTPLRPGTTRTAVRNIATHPVRSTGNMWKKFWQIPTRLPTHDVEPVPVHRPPLGANY
jgi:hypothetical protein